jgi:beta-glucanase (GH16 family)
MISKGKFEFRYGRIEARIKVPMGQGLWPAFWLLGANISQVSWPACGEVDIMEHIGNEYQNYGTFHFDSLGHRYHGNSYSLDPTLFHQYAFVWTPTTMTWLVDNNPYYSVNITNGIGNKEEFHLPFFILLNIAVGGNWPGSPSTSTIFPAEMQIDYIRVYKDNSELGLAENQESLLSVYPNPAGTSIKVQSLNSAIIKDITITSSSGQTIGTRAINLLGEIDVADLLPGLYFITCIDESDRPYSTRFIKD